MIEFDGATEEVLDSGPRRRVPRWAVAAAAALVAGAFVLIVTQHDPDRSGLAAPTSPSSGGSPTVDPDFDPNGTLSEQTLAYVHDRAYTGTAPIDTALNGSQRCERVLPDQNPDRAMRSAVTGTFPRMRVEDLSHVRDPIDGLCLLDLRASDDSGTTLVVRVVAPIEDNRVVEARRDQGGAVSLGTATQFVTVTTRAGWVVTVGTSGPTSSGPSRSALFTLAQDPSLLW